jgi:LmbE family N-acetylglucosaminyl deacetylase
MTNILVVAAHPDDELLGCGGTIARLSRQGDKVYILIVGEGVSSRYERREMAGKEEFARLKKATIDVAARLGAADLFMLDLPDNRLDQVPLLDIIKKIEAIGKKVSPTMVFTHHPGDLNIDHQCVFRATLTATRPTPDSPVKELYSFEIPSSTEWAFGQCGPAFQADTFFDVSDSLEQKIEALKIYESEVRAFPHPRSPEALRAIAQRWGSVVGLSAAEAFKLVRRIV